MKKPSMLFEDASWSLPGTQQRLFIRGSVLAHFHSHRQATPSAPEAGGQLFARLSQRGTEICHASGPYPKDRRSRFSFRPDRNKQTKDIIELFCEGLHYVGDWHTHPVPRPTPSSLDLSSMRDCFRRSRHELDSFVMVIVGTATDAASLWVSLHTATAHERLAPAANEFVSRCDTSEELAT